MVDLGELSMARVQKLCRLQGGRRLRPGLSRPAERAQGASQFFEAPQIRLRSFGSLCGRRRAPGRTRAGTR
jgi:hypothetical protein